MSLYSNVTIKRSTTSSRPTTLHAGELAYSYPANTLFIGTANGDGVLTVAGGDLALLSTATSLNVANTIVVRDRNGALQGRFHGIANSAVNLTSFRNFSISGGDISAAPNSFNGTQDINLIASLRPVPNLIPGLYGSSATNPVITVAANGRIMAIDEIGSARATYNYLGNTGGIRTVYGGDTVSFVGGGNSGITTDIGENLVVIKTDDTILRSNLTYGIGTSQNVNTILRVNNILQVTGNTNLVNAYVNVVFSNNFVANAITIDGGNF
jgi:hypothetical protein